MLYFFIMKKIVVKNKDLKVSFRENSRFKKKSSVTIFIWQHILLDVKCLTFWQRHRVLLIILETYVISCFINSIFVNYNIYYSSFFRFLTKTKILFFFKRCTKHYFKIVLNYENEFSCQLKNVYMMLFF